VEEALGCWLSGGREGMGGRGEVGGGRGGG